jgi:DNA-binding transcriptional LysR family regulator
MNIFDSGQLSRKNLNLLVVFDAVAECRSVNEAASRLSLTPSALSHALNKLRGMFDDQLFVRSRSGLQLTPRASALVEPVRMLLTSADSLLRPSAFEPEQCNQEFRLALSECSVVLFGAATIATVTRQAPKMKVAMDVTDPDAERKVHDGFFDIGVWYADRPAPTLHSKEIFRDRYIGAIGSAHPLAEKARAGQVTLEDYVSFPHIHTLLKGMNEDYVAAALARIGVERYVGLTATSFTINFPIILGSLAIGTIPSHLAYGARFMGFDFVTFDLPFEIDTLPYRMVWSDRTDRDPASAWLRDLIVSVTPPSVELPAQPAARKRRAAAAG